jgi:hypothetical protein
METTVIIVIDEETMRPVENAGVTLGFSWGMSEEVFTDSDGEVEIEHTSRANADVYVDGSVVETIYAPCRKKVYV